MTISKKGPHLIHLSTQPASINVRAQTILSRLWSAKPVGDQGRHAYRVMDLIRLYILSVFPLQGRLPICEPWRSSLDCPADVVWSVWG